MGSGGRTRTPKDRTRTCCVANYTTPEWAAISLAATVVAPDSETSGAQELYLMCDDVEAFVADMATHGIACGPVQNQGWGLLTQLTLPGGGKLGVYQPRHARPEPMAPA